MFSPEIFYEFGGVKGGGEQTLIIKLILKLIILKKLKTRSDIKKEESSTSIASINEHVASLNVKSEIEDQTTITASASSGLINENEEYGKVLTEISGTPIVVNLSGVSKVPNADNFSIDISDFKPYDMLNCQTGNYQNIVKITRDFKQKQ